MSMPSKAASAKPAAATMADIDRESWDILDAYFRDHTYPLTLHHLNSYREFLRNHIPDTIRTFNPITMVKYLTNSTEEELRVEVYVGDDDRLDPVELGLQQGSRPGIYIDRPILYDADGTPIIMTPLEARYRSLTYQTQLHADISVITTGHGGQRYVKFFPRTLLGAIPLMLHSEACILHGQGSRVLRKMGECPYDQGGYMIVDGKEKVIVSQERIVHNRLFVKPLSASKDPDFAIRGTIRCTADRGETALSARTIELYIIRQEDRILDANVLRVAVDYRPYPGAILVSLPGIDGKFPIAILFRVFGVESDRAIAEHVLGDLTHPLLPEALTNALRPSFVHAASKKVFHADAAFEYLRNRTPSKGNDQLRLLLAADVLPNIPDSFASKAKYLGYLVQQLLLIHLGMAPPSDRDSYMFQRVDISGFLLAELFQNGYRKVRDNCRDLLDREYNYGPWRNSNRDMSMLIRDDNLRRMFHPMILTELFMRSLKGMWGSDVEDPEQGKVQDLSRISYVGFLSHLRRVNNDFDRSLKQPEPHRLHSQQWGRMCPFESPDGASIGLLKNLALLAQITFGTDPRHMHRCLEHLGVLPLTQVHPRHAMTADVVRVFVNGSWFGIAEDPPTLVSTFRLYRRNGLINPFVSIAWNIAQREVRVSTDAGRICRPLRIVGSAAPALPGAPWFDRVFGTLIQKEDRTEQRYYADGFRLPEEAAPRLRGMPPDAVIAELAKTAGDIEFLDVEEENTMLVAISPSAIGPYHTHLEIHPCTMFSVVTNNIPFSNHNQAPRNYFHGAQSKQAIGVPATNVRERFDTMSYVLHYPQRPMVASRVGHYTAVNQMPNGFNVIVAVATYTGYNQEDGIILNRTSVDRGLFQITAYKSISVAEKESSPTERLTIMNPQKKRDSLGINERFSGKMRGQARYDLLDENGVVAEGTYIPAGEKAVIVGMVHERDVIVEKTQNALLDRKVIREYKDVSITTDIAHYGTVDRVYVGSRGLGVGKQNRVCKVRFRKVRRPELGDKHGSMHGQKGVVGMILPADQMPFTKDGIIPDVIINPHAFPSRMTIGHMVECVFSKLCALRGTLGDGTVFLPFDMDEISADLEKKHGFEGLGNEIMYHGRTGQMINTEIFIGPTFYYRMKHMVADKINVRGPRRPYGFTGEWGPDAISQLVQQPVEGRSKGGGLRIGEMERDVLLSYGISQFAKESMMERSDRYRWAICRYCGTQAVSNPNADQLSQCTGCGRQDIGIVEGPYAFKLFVQECEAMGVGVRMHQDPLPEQPPSAGAGADAAADDDEATAYAEWEEGSSQEGGDLRGPATQPGPVTVWCPPSLSINEVMNRGIYSPPWANSHFSSGLDTMDCATYRMGKRPAFDVEPEANGLKIAKALADSDVGFSALRPVVEAMEKKPATSSGGGAEDDDPFGDTMLLPLDDDLGEGTDDDDAHAPAPAPAPASALASTHPAIDGDVMVIQISDAPMRGIPNPDPAGDGDDDDDDDAISE